MNLAPLASLLGAALTSFAVIKWICVAFIGILVVWLIYGARTARNALDVRALKDLVKSAAQWNSRSLQDTNAMIGLMNANYAMAYLNVARSVGSDTDIERHTGASVDELLKEVESAQKKAIQRLASACPAMAPQGATHTGWLK